MSTHTSELQHHPRRGTLAMLVSLTCFTGNALLLYAEIDKMVAILLTTVVLALAIARARHLLVRAVSEGVAARDLSRFFDPGVAAIGFGGANAAFMAGRSMPKKTSSATSFPNLCS